jgi:3-hydroxyacyl-CoA dehydrogenase
VPEIADDIVNIDNAIRWGFNWAYGPFELLGSPSFYPSTAEGKREYLCRNGSFLDVRA